MISVIVPVYNVEKHLRKCIDSLLSSIGDDEIILIDDGSTDTSGQICDEYSLMSKNIITIHQKKGGASAARNTGLNIAKGSYITFIDSDDYLEENYFRYIHKLLDEIQSYWCFLIG